MREYDMEKMIENTGKNTNVRLTSACRVAGVLKKAGDVIEVEHADLVAILAAGRGEVIEDAVVVSEEEQHDADVSAENVAEN